MPLVKRSTSVLGLSLANSIKSFMQANADALASSDESTVEEGIEAIANAIAYGVAKGLSSPQMQAAFTAGIVPPGGGPVGTLIFTPLKATTTEI